jgi:hypothetical protein
MAGDLTTFTEILFIFLQPNLLYLNNDPTFIDLKLESRYLCEALMDLAMLPLITEAEDEDISDCIAFWSNEESGLMDRLNRVSSVLAKFNARVKEGDARSILDTEKKDNLAMRALNVILSVFGNGKNIVFRLHLGELNSIPCHS